MQRGAGRARPMRTCALACAIEYGRSLRSSGAEASDAAVLAAVGAYSFRAVLIYAGQLTQLYY